MSGRLRFIIAGGGTGGHVFPMIAVADAVRAQEPDCEILFVGTKDRMEATLVPKAGYELRTIPAGGLQGKGLLTRLVSLAKIPLAMISSAFIISRFGPHAVMSGGGYASWPVCRVAAFLKVPLALLEVNSIPGLAIRKISRHAAEAYTGFPSTAGKMRCPCHVTGNPIRAGVRGEAPAVRSGELRLLVIGGSQGAMGLNSMVLEALPHLAAAGVTLYITHQAGKNDLERVREAYRAAGARGQVTAFIDDMATAYREADLVIARAGATTIAELIAARRPAIFVPLPSAADQHQLRNAEQVASAGGGEVVPQAEGGEKLATRITALDADRKRIAAMGAALAALDHPDAAADVARRLIALARSRK